MSDQHYERKRPTEDTGGLGIDTKVKNTKPTTLIRFMKAVNIVTALFLIVVGILHILGGPDLIGILASIYVIMFSGILLLFEFRWKRLEKKVVRNFGFMFSWSGRAMFLLFVGTLAFGLGDIGIGGGVCTIIAVIINIYVIRTHPELREMILDQDWEARQRAEGRDLEAQAMKAVDATKAAGAAGAAAVAGAATNAQNKIQKMAEPKPGNTADGNPSGDQWEKLFDESTQQYYYHNHATGETKWSI